MPPATEIRAVRGPLLRWYRRHRRDLPWRRTRDPYAIWVSEVMLQQTQTTTVLPYYARFLDRFPDAASLAEATEEEVLSLWSGLGYYHRARALHSGARAVMERHGGGVPDNPRELRRLPGIGRYTAGAISSIAFDRPEPILDGNVRRVLCRLWAIGKTSPDRLLWSIAAALAEGPHPGDLNQGLMELGALVCTPRNPRCLLCPLHRRCRARAGGNPESFPRSKPARATEKLRVAVALVERSGKFLLERPRDGSPLRGAWDLPAVELAVTADAKAKIRATLARRHRLEVSAGTLLATAAHGILHRRLSLEIHRCRLRRGRVAGTTSLRWLAADAIDEAPVSGATLKALRLCIERAGEPAARTQRLPSNRA